MSVWFIMRGSGIVLTLLMTLSVVIGVLSTVRAGSPRWPRFTTQAIHRNVSLIAVVLLFIHAISAVVHEFVDVRWFDLFLPVGGRYVTETERTGMALAALAMDLTLAVVITSLLRTRMPHRTWRVIHLLAYLSWGAGLTHGLLVGSDVKTWWSQGVSVASLVAVGIAVVVRLSTVGHERRRERRATSGRSSTSRRV